MGGTNLVIDKDVLWSAPDDEREAFLAWMRTEGIVPEETQMLILSDDEHAVVVHYLLDETGKRYVDPAYPDRCAVENVTVTFQSRPPLTTALRRRFV